MSQAMLWIAIVDDDPSVLKALARLLRAHALHVRTYTSAREFLRRSLTSAGGRRDCRSGANRLERGSLLVSRPRIAFRYRQFRVRSQASRQDRGLREGSFGLRAQPNLLNAIKLMLSVQSHPKKYSRFRHPQISATNTASHPSRGALAIVTNVGMGCGGRGSVGRERDRRAKSFGLRERSAGAQDERRCSSGFATNFGGGALSGEALGEDGSRTAKPCGPGTRCWCQVGGGFRRPDRVSQSR
jgi:CheY-like chemotaxis protein